jgi:hypothetical protein
MQSTCKTALFDFSGVPAAVPGLPKRATLPKLSQNGGPGG